MTADAKHIVEDFRALPDTMKREVLAELVRISGRIDYPAISEDALLTAATSWRMTNGRPQPSSRA